MRQELLQKYINQKIKIFRKLPDDRILVYKTALVCFVSDGGLEIIDQFNGAVIVIPLNELVEVREVSAQ